MTEEIKDEAKEAVAEDIDIRGKVRAIILRALTERQLDKDNLKSVIHSVATGVTEGASGDAEKLEASLKQAVSGIDDALEKTVLAAKLATKEAIGKTKEFADQELKNSINELETLEDMFIDTLNVVARNTERMSTGILNDLASHLKASGTQAGRSAKDALQELQQDLSAAGRESVNHATSAGKETVNNIAQIASGILSGLADALNEKNTDRKNTNL